MAAGSSVMPLAVPPLPDVFRGLPPPNGADEFSRENKPGSRRIIRAGIFQDGAAPFSARGEITTRQAADDPATRHAQ